MKALRQIKENENEKAKLLKSEKIVNQAMLFSMNVI